MAGQDFWHNKKVLITGARGFIGSNLAKELIRRGAHVYALVSKGTSQNNIFIDIRDQLAGVIVGNICEYEEIAQIFTRNKIDTCFHLAAQPIVGTAFESPLSTFDINIRGTINILESARCAPTLERLVIASSTHVYGDNPNPPYVESFYPRPSRPYETSKACADMLTQTYHYAFGLPVAIARPTNTYGPGDLNFTRLIPKVMRSIIADEDPELVGGTAIRDYLYVKDAVSGYLQLGQRLDQAEVRGQAFNFGSGHVLSATAMAQNILDANNRMDLKLKIKPGDTSKEISRQYVSTEKAKALLGWTPKYELHDGLRETYAWYATGVR